jgi:hypothetical protein
MRNGRPNGARVRSSVVHQTAHKFNPSGFFDEHLLAPPPDARQEDDDEDGKRDRQKRRFRKTIPRLCDAAWVDLETNG